ncbi:unnamed protein product [Amaranthus hypochondriacus]
MVQRHVHVIWRGKKIVLEVNSEASLKELGEELQTLTDVQAHTIRLIVPQSTTKSSRLFTPFSDEHSTLKLQDTGIEEGITVRMMGVSENEIDHVLKDAKDNLRIAGFEEEEKRMKQRISHGSRFPLKLPEGPYIFCDFRTLELPGIELNPPPSEALKRMHMLAADPGIVAIMKKHRWRVGIMTEMAPVGYVGISPKCLLGFNKNRGEEISLRLRTDDLKGFRKYESIKKTLLHELAHMVYSEHDANFYALDKQLNQEVFALDWTKSRGHTLADSRFSGPDDMDLEFDSDSSLPYKLGGETARMSISARMASVSAAYNRFADSSITSRDSTENELPYSESEGEAHGISKLDDTSKKEEVFVRDQRDGEPDPDDLEVSRNGLAAPIVDSSSMQIERDDKRIGMTINEPDPDDSESASNITIHITSKPMNEDSEAQSQHWKVQTEPNPDDIQRDITGKTEPDPDDMVEQLPQNLGVRADEPDPDDELSRIQDPAMSSFNRINKAIELLRTELNPSEAMAVLQTLFKIIKNVSENPNEMKYKKLRKANPVFQRSVANHQAAMEVLFLIGFSEEIIIEMGKAESYLVLKRNDPGLLWLAKSSLEANLVK